MVRVSERLESWFVDHHVMMEPAKRNHVVWVGRAAFGPGDDVMRLDSIAGLAAIGSTDIAVPEQDCPTQRSGSDSKFAAVRHQPAVLGVSNYLGGRVAEDCGQGVGTHPRTGFEHYSCLAVAGDRFGGIDEHGDLRRRRIVRNAEL